VRFDCLSKFKKQPFAQEHFSSKPAKTTKFAIAKTLFKANTGQLPKTNTRAPKIFAVKPGRRAGSRSATSPTRRSRPRAR
jgi:hypothetical protein